MQDIMYYIFCAMLLGGALGVILMRDFVNSAMSMLLSMMGAAGLMLLMHAYFAAFIMVTVYGGAVMVLFVFVVMLIGDKLEMRHWGKRLALLLVWAALCALSGFFVPDLLEGAKAQPVPATCVLAKVQAYGVALLSNFVLPLQVAGVLLLAAVAGVIAIAKPEAARKVKSDML